MSSGNSGNGATPGRRPLTRAQAILVVAAVVTLGALVGFGVSMLQRPQYEAIATILIPPPEGSTVPERQLLNQASIMTSTPVLERAAERYGPSMDAALARRLVAAEASDVADVITLRALGTEAETAVRLADAVVASYLAIAEETGKATPEAIARLEEQKRVLLDRINTVEQALRDDRDDIGLRAELEALTANLKERVASGLRSTLGDVSQASYAVVLTEAHASQIHDQVWQMVGLSTLLGLALSVGFVLWWRSSQRTTPPTLRGPEVHMDERYLVANGRNHELLEPLGTGDQSTPQLDVPPRRYVVKRHI
jgi:hypothetical protein